jgi:hypothetical protein
MSDGAARKNDGKRAIFDVSIVTARSSSNSARCTARV